MPRRLPRRRLSGDYHDGYKSYNYLHENEEHNRKTDPAELQRLSQLDLNLMADLVWCFFVCVMMLLGVIGLLAKEFAAIRTANNTSLKFKIPLTMAILAIFYFWVGIGFTIEVEGGLLGYEHVLGYLPEKDYHQMYCTYFPIAIIITTLSTMAIVDRARPDTHIFFAIVSSTLISPIVMAWTWGDGWLRERNFHDFSGAATYHLTAGVSALVATLIIGPGIRSSHFQAKSGSLLRMDWCAEPKAEEAEEREDNQTLIAGSEWQTASNVSDFIGKFYCLHESPSVDNPGRLWRNKDFASKEEGPSTPSDMVSIKLLPRPLLKQDNASFFRRMGSQKQVTQMLPLSHPDESSDSKDLILDSEEALTPNLVQEKTESIGSSFSDHPQIISPIVPDPHSTGTAKIMLPEALKGESKSSLTLNYEEVHHKSLLSLDKKSSAHNFTSALLAPEVNKNSIQQRRHSLVPGAISLPALLESQMHRNQSEQHKLSVASRKESEPSGKPYDQDSLYQALKPPQNFKRNLGSILEEFDEGAEGPEFKLKHQASPPPVPSLVQNPVDPSQRSSRRITRKRSSATMLIDTESVLQQCKAVNDSPKPSLRSQHKTGAAAFVSFLGANAALEASPPTPALEKASSISSHSLSSIQDPPDPKPKFELSPLSNHQSAVSDLKFGNHSNSMLTFERLHDSHLTPSLLLPARVASSSAAKKKLKAKLSALQRFEIQKFKAHYPEIAHFQISELALVFKLYQLVEKNPKTAESRALYLFVGDLFLAISLLFSSAVAGGSITLFNDFDFIKVQLISPFISAFSATGTILALQLWAFMQPSEGQEEVSLQDFTGAFIAGFVSNSACSVYYPMWGSFVVGIVAGAIMYSTARFLDRFGVQDNLRIISMHGASGLWATLVTGLLNQKEGLLTTGQTSQLVIQFLGAVVIMGWSGFISFLFYSFLQMQGRLRMSIVEEMVGVDLFGYSSRGELFVKRQGVKKHIEKLKSS